MTAAPPATRLVWDLPVRVTHWALVLAVTGCWATHYAGIEWFTWHRRCGYAVLVLAAFRVAWGFAGTRHARFTGFVRGPAAIVAYLRSGGQTVGHNPLGALGVIALLGLMLLQAGTGLFANDEIMNTGPLYGWISPELSNRLTSLHHANSDWLLVMIGLHLAAIVFYVRFRRQPLVRAMITGGKPAALVPAGAAIDSSRMVLAIVLITALAIALALAVRAAPEAMIALY
ncbi:MAG: cytochrome b/b6 domain-containing protein [Steroidobacteraceae bacterium]|nr:cytochrome b/b6 domain-containing protein [Steroidobacteraceae bacterium]